MATTFYHITRTPEALMAEGARRDRVGTGAGIQAGRGFYLTRAENVEFWGARVGGWTLAVTLPDSLHLLARDALDEVAWNAWMIEQGFVSIEDGRMSILPAAEIAAGVTMEQARQDHIAALTFESTLIGLYAETMGYDGVDYDDQIVITNYDLLSASAFSKADMRALVA